MGAANPPAFPETRHKTVDLPGRWGSTVTEYIGGMTLRDWFAGQAMTGLLSDSKSFSALGSAAAEKGVRAGIAAAEFCYEFADHMLRVREGRSE